MISTKEPKNTTMIEPSDKSTKNRKRERSLVEIHQENLAKKQKVIHNLEIMNDKLHNIRICISEKRFKNH